MTRLTHIEGGDDLHTCVSARVPYLGPLVLVVIILVPNPDDLTDNSVIYPPLRNVGTRKKANAATILPIRHPVDGVGRLLLFSLPQLVGNENLFPPETNDHILLKHLTANLVVVATPSAIPTSCPHNIQYQAHGADSGSRLCLFPLFPRLRCRGGRSSILRRALCLLTDSSALPTDSGATLLALLSRQIWVHCDLDCWL